MNPLYLLYFLFFALGCVIGSFLNLVSDRFITGEPILIGRSRCDFCKKILGAKNLIPLFSFLFQKGKSACCKQKMSWYYPVSELMTGAVFLLAVHYSNIAKNFGIVSVLTLIYLLMVSSFFVLLFLTDAKYKLIPDKIVYPAIFISLFFIIFISFLDLKLYHDTLMSDSFGKYLVAAGFWHDQVSSALKQLVVLISSSFFIALFFITLILVTKGRGMGGGDVKLGFLIGLFNGFPGNVLAVFLGFVFGSVYSIVLISLKKKKLKDVIAFGPFLILGSLVAYIWGGQILNWYVTLFS